MISLVPAVDCTLSPALPALIAKEGNPLALRFVEFFTINIRKPNTRAACDRAVGAFLPWWERQGITSLAGLRMQELRRRLAAILFARRELRTT